MVVIAILGSSVDCVVSDWMSWSPCSTTCGKNGTRQRTRKILVWPVGKGSPCPQLLEKQRCELNACDDYL